MSSRTAPHERSSASSRITDAVSEKHQEVLLPTQRSEAV